MALLFGLVVIGPFARSRAFNHNPVWREYSYLGGMDAIALGCLTALLVSQRRFSRGGLLALGGLGTALLIFSLGFSIKANAWGLGRNGLSMTILAVGTCMVIVAAAQTEWRAPRVLGPLLRLGQRSYEVYLTHVFVVLALFEVFLRMGRPMRLVPMLFVAVIVCAGLLGEVVARFYSEPMNRWLRRRWGETRLGSVVTEAGEMLSGR
jgi:peptidoglycan/LPS O-acetylase OafA/YrhL